MSNCPEFQTLYLTEEEEKSWIEFNKVPDREKCLQDLQKLVDYLEDDSSANLIVFRNVERLTSSINSVDEFRHWENVFERLNGLPIVTIAVIDGECFGVGLQLAMTCDFRLASLGAVLQSTEVKQGYLPGMIVFRLAKFVGLGIAKRLLFMGLPYKAEDAFQVGLIDVIFSASEKDVVLDEFIKQLLPIHGTAIQVTRRLLDESFANSYEDAIGHFFAAQYKCLNLLRKQHNHDIH